tara:strand:+ start:4289 stop:4417 length:129 start_codon:yes stop_codon:yes gene_type:complete
VAGKFIPLLVPSGELKEFVIGSLPVGRKGAMMTKVSLITKEK